MKEFNSHLGKEVERQAFKETGPLGVDDTLEEDRYVAKVIGKNYEDIERLEDMEEEVKYVQERQLRHLDELKYQLEDLSFLIEAQERVLEVYHAKKQEKQKLHKENLSFHIQTNPTEYIYQETDLEKQIAILGQDIKTLSTVIKKEKITEERLEAFREEYAKLKEKYDNLEKAWDSKNASLN